MILTEKETTAIEDLKTQEQACIEKYTKYSNQAKDPVLKELFEEIARDEQKHFDSLDQVIKGKVPSVDCNDSKGKFRIWDKTLLDHLKYSRNLDTFFP